MTLDIDITDKKSREIIKILDNYPYGHLEIKFERVFWCSEDSEPVQTRSHSPGGNPLPGGSPSNQKGLHGAFSNMADTLGSMMGPPRR